MPEKRDEPAAADSAARTLEDLMKEAQRLRDEITAQLRKLRRDGRTEHNDPPYTGPERRHPKKSR